MIRASTMVFLAVYFLLTTAGILEAQSGPAISTAGRIGIAVALSTAGSLAGSMAGAELGGSIEECDTEPDDTMGCGLGGALLGFAAGSVVGASIGAYLGATLAGADPGVLTVLGASTVGVGVGLLTGMLADRLFEGDTPIFIGYSIGQASLAGIIAGRSGRN